jgi:hypothetical protein
MSTEDESDASSELRTSDDEEDNDEEEEEEEEVPQIQLPNRATRGKRLNKVQP